MSEPAVRTRGLGKRYGARVALASLDLDVDRGEFLALVGPNGAGKSTLLSLLSSLARPSMGQAWLFGHKLERGTGTSERRRAIGYVGHPVLAYRSLTCRQNLEFFGRLYSLDRVSTRVQEAAERFGFSDRLDDTAGSLSRGLLQRLSLARALLHDPALLLFDEPYTGLDATSARFLDQVLQEASRAGRTVLLSTHDLERAAALAGRVLVLRRGRKVYDERPPADAAGWRAMYERLVGAGTG